MPKQTKPKQDVDVSRGFHTVVVVYRKPASGYAGTAEFYIQSGGRYAHIFNDKYDYTDSALGNSNYATTRRVKALLDRPVGYSYLWKDGVKTSDRQTGKATLESAITLPLFAEKSTTVTQNFSKAMIYSLDIQEGESLVHFFAPHYDETLGACFKDIVTGEMKGESKESPTTALTYNDGFGSSADYRYENGGKAAATALAAMFALGAAVAVLPASSALANPIFDGWYADPQIRRYGDEWWVFPTTSAPFGPFAFRGKVLGVQKPLATGAGHHSVFRKPGTDEWYICYHRRPIPSEGRNHRVACIDRLTFGPDGDIKPVVMTE